MKAEKPEVYPPEYWDKIYESERLGWDIGYVSTPLKEYFDQLEDRNLRILIPGAGNGYEVEYLFKKGFVNTFLLDFSQKAIDSFLKRFPGFPRDRILHENFFEHTGSYDLIVEQTFFSSLPPASRPAYADKMYRLLVPGGKLAGLLFNHEFPYDKPPFGGTPEEYRALFAKFRFRVFQTAYNSIKPRQGRELFILLEKE